MATKEHFYQTPVDRTPYGSCAVVGVVALLFFLSGAFLLIKAGGAIQRTTWPQWSLGGSEKDGALPSTDDPFAGTQAELEKIRGNVTNTIQQEIDEQKAAAKVQAEEAVKKEAQKQVDTLKDQLP